MVDGADLELLTASRAKTARACRRKHPLTYHLGLRTVVDVADLRFGTLIHHGLEAWWKGLLYGRLHDDCLAAALAVTTKPDVDAWDAAKAWVLLTGYHFRWLHEPYEVLGVEVRFEGELLNPETGAASRTWRRAGKIDVLVRDRRGRVLIVEHKTSSEDISPGSDYWKRLRMDGQVSTYFEGARLLGHSADACLYDVLGKFQQRQLQVPLLDEHGDKIVHNAAGERVRTGQGKWRQTADTAQGFVLQTRPETLEEYKARLVEAVTASPEKYFQRGEVVRLEAEMREAQLDDWQLGKQLREEQLAGRYPRNPDACDQYHRTCQYFGLCTGEASAEDERLYQRVANVHPELAAEAPP